MITETDNHINYDLTIIITSYSDLQLATYYLLAWEWKLPLGEFHKLWIELFNILFKLEERALSVCNEQNLFKKLLNFSPFALANVV